MEIAVCQTDIVYRDKKYNLITAEDYISQCVENGADLVLFPEMSMTGYELNPELISETPQSNEVLSTMSGYAARYGTAIGVGYVLFDGGVYTNRYAIVGKDGSVLCDYSKIHPFSPAGEDECYTAGDSLEFCEIDGVTVCPLICYDLRFPEIFQAASEKADVIVVASNWDGVRNNHWKLLLQARALENQCYILGVNRIGSDGRAFYVGNSMVIDPEGQIIDVLEGQAGFMLAEVSKERVEECRDNFPLKKDRRPDLYKKLL
ncbi:MAG: carbon-nitrogen family hydrolase [Butyrivibrio sp.]|nr:carbon-nitrogen family hydrolase [Butyrivibrio sp.]